jgi:hypothetical protein
MQTINLNVTAPEQTSAALRAAAQAYRESSSELAAAWQDPNAGKVWDKLADVFDAAANRCDATIAKHFK